MIAPLSLRAFPMRSLAATPLPLTKSDAGEWAVRRETRSVVVFLDTFRTPGLTISQEDTDFATTLGSQEFTGLIIEPRSVKTPPPYGPY